MRVIFLPTACGVFVKEEMPSYKPTCLASRLFVPSPMLASVRLESVKRLQDQIERV